ncbi:MAG: squalene/phytoene synthase family protein [Elusimicrobiaceae bacterium]|nr:squalene/phytoene synthase family protein [Elusimicrobiaceae bacterium]
MDLNTLLKNTSRSLYLSAKILPDSIRPAFGLAYLLCRYADTIADTPLLEPSKRLYWVEQFPQIVRTQDAARSAELTRDLSGRSSTNPYEAALIAHLPDCLAALKKIPTEQQAFIFEVVENVCTGMKKDLTAFAQPAPGTVKALATPEELKTYCRLMGGKPGLFWSQLIVQTLAVQTDKEAFFTWGQQIGDALQIVNVLRDLPQDLQNSRCYFPQSDLQAAGLQVQDLFNVQNSARFEPIKNKWLAWGKQNLKQAPAYYRALPKTALRVRASVAWPMLWTADTFIRLAQTQDVLNVHKRVKIPRRIIYGTMLVTPLLLLSNTLFEKWLNRKLKSLPDPS